MKGARLATLGAAAVLMGALLPAATVAKGGGSLQAIIYSSVPASPLKGNLPSLGFEAVSLRELVNWVTFTGTNRKLTNVVVTMSSFGCESGFWNKGDCVTTPGTTFSVPITFNVYAASEDGGLHPGALLASVTQTFIIPYRPSASPRCGDGRWYDQALRSCFNGYATNITFQFGGVTLPDSVVYGIAYNTSHRGYVPVGEAACFAEPGGCGYDSLNVGLTEDPTDLRAGVNTQPGTAWMNTSYAGFYCDGGADGVDTFRLDSPTSVCWGVNPPYDTAPFYMPAVQFKASAGG